MAKSNKKAEPDTSEEAQLLEREKIFREIEVSKTSGKRYRGYWREMVIRIKMPDIVRSVETAWQTMERAIDLKDYSISLLLDSLEDAENQHRRANSSRVEIFDRSIQAHHARLDVDTLFYGNVENILSEKACDFENIGYYRNKGENLLRKIDLLQNEWSNNLAYMARSTAFSKIDTFVEDGKNERRIVTTQLQIKLENLWNDLRNVFTEYRKSTEDRRKAYEAIRKKDEADQQTIIRQHLRTVALLDEIGKYREKIHSYTNEAAIELQEIIREFNYFHNAYRVTNERFTSGCNKDKYKVTTLCKEYKHSSSNLTRLMSKAERTFSLMEICRKYETQDEKILPTIDKHPVKLSPSEYNVFSIGTAVGDLQNSVNFWRKLGLAQLILTELRLERDRLLMQVNLQRDMMRHILSDESLELDS